MVGVKPGTWDCPTITVTDDDVRVLVRGVPISKLVQLPRTRRWMISVRGSDVPQPSETYRHREQAIDAIRAMYAGGVPEDHRHPEIAEWVRRERG
ncbi:hypothetical protein ASD11_01400 [Aeromicrobium sp. Root495]|nr:hypothetical protein ASD11_01400 [Aeromicrobium sp. Root495]